MGGAVRLATSLSVGPTPRLRAVFVLGISTLGVILIVIGVVVALFVIGGAIAVVKRSRAQDATFAEHVEAADSALEQARALDKGWHRETMEEAARAAIGESRPGWSFDDLHLVLVDDRPGVSEDRAHFMAMGSDANVRVILAREGDRWVAERVE